MSRRAHVLRRTVLASVVALAAGFTPGVAQTITLEDALRLAEGGNPEYRRAVNDTGLNSIEMNTRWLDELLPSATLSLSTGLQGNLRRIATDDFGNPIENPNATWNYFSQTNQQLDIRWNFQGLSLFQTHRRQSLINRGRELTQARVLTDVQVRVRQLYMDALEQRELRESARELLEARRVDFDVAERLFSLALKTRVDLLNAELAVEQQALALRQQEGAFDRALLDLRTELGIDDQSASDLADEELPVFDPTGLDVEALVRAALSDHPRLAEAANGIEQAQHTLSQEQNWWWPQLAFGFTAYRQPFATDFSSGLFDPGFDQDLESNFYIQMALPAFNGFFGARERREQTMVQLRNQRETDRETRLGLERTVRGAVLTLESEFASLQLAARSLEIAEEALRLAREQYRLDQITFEQLRSSFDSEAQSRQQVITARYAFVDALLALEEAVGGTVRPGPARP